MCSEILRFSSRPIPSGLSLLPLESLYLANPLIDRDLISRTCFSRWLHGGVSPLDCCCGVQISRWPSFSPPTCSITKDLSANGALVGVQFQHDIKLLFVCRYQRQTVFA